MQQDCCGIKVQAAAAKQWIQLDVLPAAVGELRMKALMLQDAISELIGQEFTFCPCDESFKNKHDRISICLYNTM